MTRFKNENLSITERLRLLGFAHRSHPDSGNTGSREVFRIANGDIIGRMTADESLLQGLPEPAGERHP